MESPWIKSLWHHSLKSMEIWGNYWRNTVTKDHYSTLRANPCLQDVLCFLLPPLSSILCYFTILWVLVLYLLLRDFVLLEFYSYRAFNLVMCRRFILQWGLYYSMVFAPLLLVWSCPYPNIMDLFLGFEVALIRDCFYFIVIDLQICWMSMFVM